MVATHGTKQLRLVEAAVLYKIYSLHLESDLNGRFFITFTLLVKTTYEASTFSRCNTYFFPYLFLP